MKARSASGKAAVAKKAPVAAKGAKGRKPSHSHHHHKSHESAKTRHMAAIKAAKTRQRRKLAGGGVPCTVAALADALLLATGLRASPGELDAILLAAGGDPDDGAVLAGVLAAASRLPMAGLPRVAWYRGAVQPAPFLLAGFDLTLAQADQVFWDGEMAPPWGPHAAVLVPGGLLSWGGYIPAADGFLASAAELWEVGWL